MGNEIEVGPIQAGQTEGIPAYPNDEIRLVRTLLAQASQARGTGKIAVANADLARDRRAALDRLGAVLVGQLQVREAAAPEVVDRVQPPTGRLAAALAVATAVGIAQDASGPVHRGAGRCSASRLAITASRNATALSSRLLTAGSLIL